jgi:hypothetical protein
MDKDANIVWWIIGIIIVLSLLGGTASSGNDYDGYYTDCYDADPTQWTEMVCD